MERQTSGACLSDDRDQRPHPGKILSPIFQGLDLWVEETARPGDEQMAVDEVLLMGGLTRPLLRHYRWQGPWASFGYSQSLADARREAPGFDLVRRWTGGGVVRHDADWTFSLLVPVTEEFFRVPPRASYEILHATLEATLLEHGARVHLAGPGDCQRSLSCFTGPSLHDLMTEDGKKICGGAQRRTKLGMLHQGSIQGCEAPERLGETLARHLSGRVAAFEPPLSLGERSVRLAATRYGSREWTERIP